jgi:hypothetical protein
MRWKIPSLITRGVFTLLVLSAILLCIIEWPPRTIEIRKESKSIGAFHVVGVASELIAQDVTEDGVWASRGYDLYFKGTDQDDFHWVSRLRMPFGTSYLGSLKTARNLLNHQEILELLVMPTGTLLAFAGGYVWRSTDIGKTFIKVADMDHFGLGQGRGVMPNGYTVDEQGHVYWGEYWKNPNREALRIFKSEDDGATWQIIHSLPAGDISHIHAVQYDPFSKLLWVATGDDDAGCFIGYSFDGGKTFVEMGSGAQKWRAVSLLFTKEHVYWGMDGISPQYTLPRVFRWNRATHKTEEVGTLNTKALYSAQLDNGTLFISTYAVGGKAILWRSDNGDAWHALDGWERERDNRFGVIRMIADQDTLLLSIINLQNYNGDLIMLSPTQIVN